MQATPVEIHRENDKPAWEFVRGRWLQKMSPKPIQSRLQSAFLRVLDTWGAGRGEAFPELHVLSLLPGDPKHRQLVPDVCFYFYDRIDLTGVDADYPRIPPDITIECKSPDDTLDDVAWKRARYIAWGVKMVVDADPYAPNIDIHGADVYPDLAVLLRACFDAIVQRRDVS
jgi:Uma2 family endonuclease